MIVRDLEIRLRPDSVTVAAEGLGRAEARLEIVPADPVLRRAIERLGPQAERRRDLTAAWDEEALPEAGGRAGAEGLDGRALGGLLYEAMLGGDRQALLARCRGPQGEGVRIVLEIDPRSAGRSPLAALPWELLYDRREQRFLALDRASPVVRRIPVAVAPRPAPRSGRLRILAVAAQPADSQPLDLAAELAALDRLDRRRGIRVAVLAGRAATLDGIRRALETHRPQVLHFMGHGRFDPSSGRGELCLVDADGRTDPLAGTDLAATLHQARSLRLVVLNACDTARSAHHAEPAAPMTGVASAVVLAGVPSVIAMQRPIGDRAAIVFARELYLRIAAGEPVDQAATLARQAVRTEIGNLEWSTPALFAGDTGQLRVYRPSVWGAVRRAALAALAVSAPFAALAALPSPTAEIELEVTARRVAFGVAGAQRVTPPIAVERLAARDLGAARLPGGELAADRSRLDVEVVPGADGAAGSVTLQPVRATGKARVTLAKVRAGLVRLTVDGGTRELGVVVAGAWRVRRRGGDWQAGLSDRPEQLALVRSAGPLSVDLAIGESPGRALDATIAVDALSLVEVREHARADRTEVEVLSTVTAGRLRVGRGGGARALEPADVLDLDLDAARIHRLALSATGVDLHLTGRVSGARLTTPAGAVRSLMPSRLAAIGLPGRIALAAFVAACLLAALGWRRACDPRTGYRRPHWIRMIPTRRTS